MRSSVTCFWYFWLIAELFLVHKEFEERKKKTSLTDLLLAKNPAKMTLGKNLCL